MHTVSVPLNILERTVLRKPSCGNLLENQVFALLFIINIYSQHFVFYFIHFVSLHNHSHCLKILQTKILFNHSGWNESALTKIFKNVEAQLPHTAAQQPGGAEFAKATKPKCSVHFTVNFFKIWE